MGYAESGGADPEAFERARHALDVLRGDDVMVASYSALLATCALLSPIVGQLRPRINGLIKRSYTHLAKVRHKLGKDSDIYQLAAQYSLLANVAWYTQPGKYAQLRAAAGVNDELVRRVIALGFESTQVQALYWMVAVRAASRMKSFRWIPGAELRREELPKNLASIAELGYARLVPPPRKVRATKAVAPGAVPEAASAKSPSKCMSSSAEKARGRS